MVLTDNILDALGGNWNSKSEKMLKDVLHKLILAYGAGWKENIPDDF